MKKSNRRREGAAKPNTGGRRGAPYPALAIGVGAFLSGLAAVGHELVWTRRLLDVLGCSGDAVAAVFGIFLLGNALGAGLASRLLRRPGVRRCWLLAGWSQLLLAATALPILWISRMDHVFWRLVGIDSAPSAGMTGLRFALALLLMMIPAAVCGTFLPLFFAAGSDGEHSLKHSGPVFYGINTLGGLGGVLLVPFALMPALGVWRGGLALCGLNLVLGGWCLWQMKRKADSPGSAEKPAKEHGGAPPGRVRLLQAFACGGLVLAAELLVFHHFNQVLLSGVHVTPVVLGSVLLGLGLAALLVGRFAVTPRACIWALFGASLGLALEPFWFCSLTQGLTPLPPGLGVASYIGKGLFLGVAVCGPVFLILGVLFPAIFSAAAEETGDVSGRFWGCLLLANGLGALAGSLTGQRLLMPWVGPWFGMGILATACAAVLGVTCRRRPSLTLGLLLLVEAVVIPAALLGYKRLPLVHLPSAGVRVVASVSGSDGLATLVIDEKGSGGSC